MFVLQASGRTMEEDEHLPPSTPTPVLKETSGSPTEPFCENLVTKPQLHTTYTYILHIHIYRFQAALCLV